MTGIPTFNEINELHRISETLQVAVLDDFHIYRNEDADQTCRQTMFVHRCGFYQVSIDQQSGYSLYHHAERIDTSANMIYFAGAGKLISWQTQSDKRTWKGYNIIFKPEFVNSGHNNYNFRKEFPFLRTDNNAGLAIQPNDHVVFELCEKMLHEQNNRPPDPNILRHYLLTLLYTLRRVYARRHETVSRQISREAEIAGRFEELLYGAHYEQRTINSYAAELFVSPKYLTEATKSVYGMTAKEMIMLKTLEEARSLLLQTNLTLTEIALKLDFNDTSNFIKFFKRLAGEGPTTFRERGLKL